jgi:hypothetical protein
MDQTYWSFGWKGFLLLPILIFVLRFLAMQTVAATTILKAGAMWRAAVREAGADFHRQMTAAERELAKAEALANKAAQATSRLKQTA